MAPRTRSSKKDAGKEEPPPIDPNSSFTPESFERELKQLKEQAQTETWSKWLIEQGQVYSKAASLLTILGVYANVSQLALSPVYGSIPSAIWHNYVLMAAAFVGWAGNLFFKRNLPLKTLVMLPLVAIYIPMVQFYLFKLSGILTAHWGPVVTEALTLFPLMTLTVASVADVLESLDLSGLPKWAADAAPGFGSYGVYKFAEMLSADQLGSHIGKSIISTRVGLELVLAGAYTVMAPSKYLLFTIPALLHTAFLNTHLMTPMATQALDASLATQQWSLLDRRESLTGYMSVLESHERGFRVMRCDHSLLGGEWTHLEKPIVAEPIYAVFTMLEAVRLVKVEKKVPDNKAKALNIGLGIGTSPSAMIAHGIDTTIVEIDPVVYEYAVKYFGLPPNHTAVIEDAVSYTARAALDTPEKYDYILHDVFTGGAEPIPLFTLEFLQSLNALLKPDGVIAINYAGDFLLPPLSTVMKTIREVFPSCRVFRESPQPSQDEIEKNGQDFDNVVVFCRKTEKKIAFRHALDRDFLQSKARAQFMVPQHEVPESAFLSGDKVGLVRNNQTDVLVKHHDQTALGHWTVMRTVLPKEIWESCCGEDNLPHEAMWTVHEIGPRSQIPAVSTGVSVKSSDLEPMLGSGLTVQMTSKLHARQMVRSISRRATTRASHHATLQQHAPPGQRPMHDREPNHGILRPGDESPEFESSPMGKTNRDKNGNYEYDIVVVGAGLAGISAALQALEHDQTLSVLLIDENDVAATCVSRSSDLDVLLNGATSSSAELREWLGRRKDGAIQDKKGLSYRRLLCMEWPSRNRQKYKRWMKKGKAGTADASEALLKSAKAKEGAKENPRLRLKYRPACRAVRLVRGHNDGNPETLLEKGDDKAVTGVECEVLPRANGYHRVLRRYLPRLKRKAPRHHGGSTVKQVPAKRTLFRVRAGVVLATGNPASCSGDGRSRRGTRAQVPVGSDLDAGKSPGVELARQIGGAVASVSAYIDGPKKGSSSPSPVASLAREHMCGIAVARATGQRFAAEDLHVDVFTKELRRKADGEAFLILDSKQWGLAQKKMKKERKKKRKQEGGEESNSKRTQGRQHQKAKTLDALAQQIGVDADGLGKAVSAYNEAIRAGRDDAFRKGREYCRTVLERAPFYALDVSVPSGRGRSPTPRRRVKLLDLIKVDGGSGLVLGEEGRQIKGLYAAGRCATVSSGNSCGVAAELYPINGGENVELGSSADCVASGKKAGRHVASSRKTNVPSNVEGKTAKG